MMKLETINKVIIPYNEICELSGIPWMPFINFKKGIKSIGSDKICDNSYFSMHHMDKEKFVIAGSYGSLSNKVETEVIKENFIDFLIDKLKEFNSGENINNDNINRNIIQIHEFGSFWVKYGPLEDTCIDV